MRAIRLRQQRHTIIAYMITIHHAQVMQSISLNGRLAALVCLAYPQNMGFGKIAFLRADVDVHDVMDSDGSQSILLKVHPQPHHPIHLILSCLARSVLLVRFLSLIWHRSMARRVYHGSMSESDDEFTDQPHHHDPGLAFRVSMTQERINRASQAGKEPIEAKVKVEVEAQPKGNELRSSFVRKLAIDYVEDLRGLTGATALVLELDKHCNVLWSKVAYRVHHLTIAHMHPQTPTLHNPSRP
jgi:hypothetical protein